MRPLLTHEEKVSAILSLQKEFHRKGELFLPDDETYPIAFTDDNIEAVAKKVFVWLGIKPTNITYTIGADVDLIAKANQGCITISKTLATNPFVAFASICKQVLSLSLLRNKIEPDDELLELASIELGLGLVFINTFDSENSLRNWLNQTLCVSPKNPTSLLTYYQPSQYATIFNAFVKNHDLHATAIREHTVPWATAYLTNVSLESSRLTPEPFVRKEMKRLSKTRARMAQICMVLVLIVGLIVFLSIHRPRHLSVQLESQKENIEILESSYTACMNSLKQKQQSYDSSDFFMLRQLDAHLSRCTSIGNMHDFQVNNYNQKLREAGLE